ncbi:Hypothetical predicted protein [Mytilus galloprovincialis]|uniref:Uncharacterized protein n=1 Tax=Mytilus galloprovincialis TaxID=29158 RepID=A0A8B6HQF0_MYTGA|nr:Hypothetical predicted protein [Mytilus galloprovincialis]
MEKIDNTEIEIIEDELNTEETTECLHSLDQAFKKSKSERVKCSLKSKSKVHEIMCVKYMTLDLAYDEYIGKIPKEFQLNFTTNIWPSRHSSIQSSIRKLDYLS